MTLVDEIVTRRVADLARLELTEEEVRTLTEQLRKTIQHVDLISELDTSNVEPTFHPIPLAMVMREDVVEETELDEEGHPKILKSAPDVLYDGYRVPQIV